MNNKNTLPIQIFTNIIRNDEPKTPPIKLRCTSPPPILRAKPHDQLKYYRIRPFPNLDELYSTPKQTKQLIIPSAPKISKGTNKLKITDMIPKKLTY